ENRRLAAALGAARSLRAAPRAAAKQPEIEWRADNSRFHQSCGTSLPEAGQDERRPLLRMGLLVTRLHLIGLRRRVVLALDVLAAGDVEGALQAEDAVAAGHVAQARLARRQHGQLHAVQVAADDVLAEQDAAVGRPRRGFVLLLAVGAGEDEAGQQQRAALA